MDDPAAMRVIERIGHLDREPKRLGNRQRTAAQTLGERPPVDVLHDEKRDAGNRFRRVVRIGGRRRGPDVVERADVGVIEARNDARLALEPLRELGVAGKRGRQDFDRDRALEPCVAGLVDFSHPTRAKRADDLVRTELGPGLEGHKRPRDYSGSGRDPRRLSAATGGAAGRGPRRADFTTLSLGWQAGWLSVKPPSATREP